MYDIKFDEGLTEVATEYSINDNRTGSILLTENLLFDIKTDEKVDFSNAIYESKDPKPLFFHNDLIRFQSAPYTYFNLHGSRYLSFDYEKRIPCFNINGTDYPSSIGQYNIGGNPNEYLLFSPIIVGYTKSQRALSEPFYFGFTSFALDCNTCDKFFSFGFSFKDPHINSIINTYLRKDVEIECVVQGNLEETISTPYQLLCKKESTIGDFKICNNARIFENGIKDYWENRACEEYI